MQKTYTFSPSTIAKSAEVNKNFDDCVAGINLMPNLILSHIQRQGIVNGGMEVSQENGVATVALANNTAKYACDLFSLTPSGTAVSAGTQAQVTNSTIGASGNALKLAGVTITGTGTIKQKYRMETADAIKYKNKAVSFSMLELQDTGGSLNYTIQINKANAADNFSAVTQIAISGSLAVPSATGTLIKLENVSMGACSNGIEIVVTIPCGAITTKNFETTEWQMNVGEVALPFVCGSRSEELEKVKRHYEVFGSGFLGRVTAATAIWFGGSFSVEKRVGVTPTLTTTAPNITEITLGGFTGSGSVFNQDVSDTTKGINGSITGFSGLTSGAIAVLKGSYIISDARFTA